MSLEDRDEQYYYNKKGMLVMLVEAEPRYARVYKKSMHISFVPVMIQYSKLFVYCKLINPILPITAFWLGIS